MADKPNVQLSLAQVRKSIVKPEVFRVALSNSKVITFPDLYELESSEAEEIFASLNMNATNWKVLEKWLSPADAKALKAEKLTIRELGHVVNAAVNHYEESVRGDAGKDDD